MRVHLLHRENVLTYCGAEPPDLPLPDSSPPIAVFDDEGAHRRDYVDCGNCLASWCYVKTGEPPQ